MDRDKLTNSQHDAIESIGDSMAVIAGAGSGKTLVLVERCMRIVEETPAGLERLLAITFTEKAAAELSAKLKPLLPPNLLPRLAGAWIGTFHAFCARVLRGSAPAAGLNPAFRILDENGARLLARRSVEESFLALLDGGDEHAAHLVEELEYPNATGLIEDLMGFRWHADRIFEMPRPGEEREKRLLDAAARCYRAAKDDLLSRLARMGAADFQELEIRTLGLLETNADILASCRRRFRHILVDEYQDTNDIQAKMVALLHDPSVNRLFIVGDPRQSIYRFRGANVSCFMDTEELIRSSGGRTVDLSDNFRSRPGILGFVNRFSRTLKGGTELVAAREKERAPAVTALLCRTGDDAKVGEQRAAEAEAITRHIGVLVENGAFAFGDIACLFQAITATEEYEAAFRRHGIPFRVFGGRHLLERPEVTDLLASLAYAADPKNDTALLALVRSPLIGLSDDECALLAGPDGKKFKGAVRRHPSAAPLLSRLDGTGVHRTPSEILSMVLDDTGYEIFCSRIDPSGGRQANIDRLITLAQSLEREAPLSLAAFVDFISTLRKESARMGDPPAAGESAKVVRCMTVHAAKGLEFPVVVLPDLVRRPVKGGGAWVFVRGKGLGFKWRDPLSPFSQLIPSENYKAMMDANRAEEEAENRRLLYVATTRAMERLILPLHDCEKSGGRWHEWMKPLIGEGVEILEIAAPVGAEAGAPEHAKPSYVGEPSVAARAAARLKASRTFTVSQLESFDRCPQEYHLKYEVGLPAEMILAKRGGGIPANIRGSIIHGVIESLAPGEEGGIEDVLRQQCLAHQVPPDRATLSELKGPLETFVKDPLFKELASGRRELRFDWKFGAHIVTGKIDWLKETGTEKEIVDFKTDRITEGQLERRAASYHLQMDAYGLAAEAAGAGKIDQTRLHFLSVGRSHILPFDGERREKGMRRIGAIIERIVASDFELGKFVPPCAEGQCTCPYHLNGLCWLDRQK
ncbi:MAG: ATP-dependent DNA helicase [Pseudomonadota bacterium]